MDEGEWQKWEAKAKAHNANAKESHTELQPDEIKIACQDMLKDINKTLNYELLQ
ncbi:hypothetical protein FRC06_003735 [Ceratobasidium sp. 370]|nr:hypothetical protein FRC06_003735 [Ceratobasidium sp. 370]